MNGIKKWFSRKLFVAIGGVIIVLISEQIGLVEAGLAEQAINLLEAYIYGQSAVDLSEKLGLKEALINKLRR